MSVPDLPFVGQKNWGTPLNAGIEARTSSDYLAGKLAEDGPFRSSLMSTIGAEVGQQVPPAVTAALAAEEDTIRDIATQAAQDAVDGLALVMVCRHGDNPDEARPAGDVVWWIGSVEPVNALAHDVWDDSEVEA